MTTNIVNTIFTCSLGVNIKLSEISGKLTNCRYDKRRFSGAIIQFRKPKATVLLFSTGRAVIAGARTEEQATDTISQMSRRLEDAGLSPQLSQLQRKNTVAACDMGQKIDLYRLVKDYPQQSLWEPELFNGLKFQFERKQKAVAIVFASGKFNVTGAGSEENTIEKCEKMKEILNKYVI